MTAMQLCKLFKALSDHTRFGIMQLLIGKEMCVCEIIEAFDKSQPVISHHLKVLKSADLLSEAREGKWIMYSIRPQIAAEAAKVLQTFAGTAIVRVDPRKGCIESRCSDAKRQ